MKKITVISIVVQIWITLQFVSCGKSLFFKLMVTLKYNELSKHIFLMFLKFSYYHHR